MNKLKGACMGVRSSHTMICRNDKSTTDMMIHTAICVARTVVVTEIPLCVTEIPLCKQGRA